MVSVCEVFADAKVKLRIRSEVWTFSPSEVKLACFAVGENSLSARANIAMALCAIYQPLIFPLSKAPKIFDFRSG